MANINQIIEEYLQEQLGLMLPKPMDGGAIAAEPPRFVIPIFDNPPSSNPNKPEEGSGDPNNPFGGDIGAPPRTPPIPDWAGKYEIFNSGWFALDGNGTYSVSPLMFPYPEMGGYHTHKPK
tara:strand:- start:348 stop:710 length:363 start_codon:yes stop_codon:yes gene_type:complete